MLQRKKKPASRRPPGSVHGSHRAMAWVHLVINSLLEALPIEVSLLEKGNTTWRHNSHQLEHIRHIENYLSLNGRHALRDFLHANPKGKELFQRHDRLLNEIAEAATLAHARL